MSHKSSQDIISIDQQYSFEVYPKRNVVFTKGVGSTLFNAEGNEYLDLASGISVANLGHSNSTIINALKDQLDKLVSCPGIFYNDTRALFQEKLLSIVPKNLKRVFLCNSGTEAIEGAIKFAKYTTKKSEFICFNRSFHGRTLGALSATFDPKYKKDFLPLIDGFHHVSYNNIEKVLEKINENTAGIILELVQGEGGVIPADQEFVNVLRKICTEKKILLIIDEIQTGFGRTGETFASLSYNVEPDIMCLAKAIAGGVPMGAVVVSENVKIDIGKHGSTFGGNPLACAGGIATIDFLVEHNITQQSKEKGEYIRERLEKEALNIPNIRSIRCKGMMIGIELKKRNKEYIEKLLEEKRVVTLPAGKTILRLLPALTISYEEIDKGLDAIIEVLKEN